MKCQKQCKKPCCPYPRCLLCPVQKQKPAEGERLRKYLALPFPEDDV